MLNIVRLGYLVSGGCEPSLFYGALTCLTRTVRHLHRHRLDYSQEDLDLFSPDLGAVCRHEALGYRL